MLRFDLIRTKLIVLAFTMFVAVLLASGIGGYILYQTSISETAERLTETAKSNARMIEAVAFFDETHSKEMHSGVSSFEGTLAQIKSAHERFRFGHSGEFTLAKNQDYEIVFLMRNYLAGMDVPEPISFDQKDRAEPMRRALSGESGWMIGNDYRGVLVMAAYEPVKILNLGLVAKIDLEEIRAPFIKAGMVMIALAILVSLGALRIFYQTSRQISGKFEDNTRKLMHEKEIAQSFLDIAGAMMVALDKWGNITLINQKACQVVDWSEQEALGKNWFENFLPHDVKEEVIGVFEKIITGNIELLEFYENTIRTRGGDERIIAWHNSVLKEQDGQTIIGVLSSGEDITERKQAEQALAKSEERFSLAMKGANDGLWDWDLQTNDVSYSARWKSMLGYAENELKNGFSTWEMLVHPDDIEPAKQVINDYLGGTIPRYELEFRMKHKDGHWVNILSRGFAIHSESSGEAVRFIGTHVDITERKIAEESARLANEELQYTFDISPSLICVANANTGYFTEINSAVTRMLGYSVEEFTSKPFMEFIHPDDRQTTNDEVTKQLKGSSTTNFENRYLCKDGSYKWLVWHVTAADMDGMVHAVATDITEIKQAEKEHARLNSELQQSQKMESLGHLTGGIAHDFNNLLGIINGYAGLAQDILLKQGESKLAEYVRNIHEAGARATALVAQMLSFSRGDQNENIPTQFAPLIKDEIKMLRSTLPSTIEIKSHIDPNLPDVLMNPTQLHQILMNLSINARDAMNGVGELTIRLKMAHDLDIESTVSHKPVKGDWVELCVNDTGSGIDSETIKNIFNPFFTTKEIGKGTGMGLSVIYRIMEDHGGHIMLDSELGKGSSFCMLFPPFLGDAANQSGLEQEPVEIPEGDGSEILVVDDEPMLAIHMSELVKNHGYEAFVVTDSTEALEIFKQDPDRFSMLITDQTMPKMTGAELISELRKIRPKLPVIMCSGFSDKIDPKGASELNIFYIDKPVDVKKLLLKIPALLNNNSSISNE